MLMEEFEKPVDVPDTQAQRNLEHAEHIAILHDRARRTNERVSIKCGTKEYCPCRKHHQERQEAILLKAINTLWPERTHSRIKTS